MSICRCITIGMVILLMLSASADGLRCYKCSGCNDASKLESSQIVTVENDVGYACSKTTARGSLTGRDAIRNCVQGDIAGVGTWCCYKDLCNGAIRPVSFGAILVTIVTITIVNFI